MRSDDTNVSLCAEEKAKLFLKDVMGRDTYKKFIKDGKIEIKSGKYNYELTTHGTVTNKTTNQTYCIILAPGTPDRDHIPLFDLIAIKFAWLKYRVNLVEKIANKRSLGYSEYERYITDRLIQRHTLEPREYDVGYAGFVRHMETIEWRREQLTVDESIANLVSIHDVKVDTKIHIDSRPGAAPVIQVRAPAGRIISIMGEEIIGNSFIHADRLGIRLCHKNGDEIPLDTYIEIVKDIPNGEQYILPRARYSTINITKNNLYTNIPKKVSEWFAFKDTVVLNSGEALKIRIIEPEFDIDSGHTRISLNLDLWTRWAGTTCNTAI